MSSSILLDPGTAPSDPRSASRGPSQSLNNSVPKRPQPSSENISVQLPFISSPNIDPSQSRGILRERPGQQSLLPSEKVFPIQIGSELFRLSGASLTSDGPSYFTRFFEDQIRQSEENGSFRTLYIDRDPTVFQDIARHLQGYHIQPLNGTHYVRLFADAQFYSLPRLISQLFESGTFIQIGDRHFRVPKDIFNSPGDTPNYFTLGFAAFFSSPHEIFPGLDRTDLLRPPSITPPSVPSRSADIFDQLLNLLHGYPLHIRNEDHRAELLRDCRYFHLKGLEQKLIAHEISFNPSRQTSEILIRLEDVKPSGISFMADTTHNDGLAEYTSLLPTSGSNGWVHYSRPFVDITNIATTTNMPTTRELILEVGSDPTILNLRSHHATFHGFTKARISALLQIIAGKLDGPKNVAADGKVKFRMDGDTDLMLDGKPADAAAALEDRAPKGGDGDGDGDGAPKSKKRKLDEGLQGEGLQGEEVREVEWKVRTGQWRFRVQAQQQEAGKGGVEIVMVAVKIDAFTCERARNARRKFLS